jgi:hypothetical protein
MIPAEMLQTALRYQADVSERMIGRLGDPERPVAAVIAAFAVLSGDGDHCEIGTLWGGSAIVTAMLKQHYGMAGQVCCIDPFDGYYVGIYPYAVPNDKLKVPVSIDIVLRNADMFGVAHRLEFIQAKSQPWPIDEHNFSSALIDGDHWGMAPLYDWLSLEDIVSKYIAFDNYDPTEYPNVVAAVDVALNESEWKCCYNDNNIFILENKE